MAAVAALPDDAEICGCNGVCKGKIVERDHGQGADVARRRARPHQGVRLLRLLHRPRRAADDADARRRLQSGRRAADVRLHDARPRRRAPPDHRQGPEDASPPSCRSWNGRPPAAAPSAGPALNYYLVCDWPDEYADDYQSRFINERVHANIQKDGTYSVVPRMWGGVTSAAGTARHRRRRRQVRTFRRSRSPAASASTCSASRRKTCRRSGPTSARPASSPAHAYAKGAAHGEDLRRLRLVPLRHAGFDRAWHPHREIHVGLVDAGQGQDGGLRLSAQLRRGDLQGRRRHLRRFAATRSISPARPVSTSRARRCSCLVKTEDEALEHHRRAGADVSRAGPLSRAHLQMGEAHRRRRDPPADRRRLRKAPGATSTASSSPRSSRRSIRGRSASPARTSTSSSRWRPIGFAARQPAVTEADELDCIGALDRHPAARRALRAARRRAGSPSSAPRTTSVFAIDDRCPHKGGPLSQGIVHGDER